MGIIVVGSSRVIDAPPDRIYAFLADFRDAHRKILPPNFSNYRVDEGSTGTVVSYRFRAGARQRDYRMTIEADEAALRIVERDESSSLATAWRLTPESGGAKTSVAIETTWDGAKGIGGFFERTFAPRVLRRIYDEELSLLAAAFA